MLLQRTIIRSCRAAVAQAHYSAWRGRVLLLLFLLSLSSLASDVETLYQAFQNPPRTNSLMPYWFWNGPITPANTRRQIREMIKQGVYQAVVFPWDGMGVQYLSEEYWQQVSVALDTAKKLGFTLNFTDEYDWPSGHAWVVPSDKPEVSRVLQAHPELRMHRLDYVEESVEGPLRWTWRGDWKPALVAVAREDSAGSLDASSCALLPVGAQALEWQAPPGRWRVTAYRLVPAVGAHNTRLDLLNPDTTRFYLQMVYEQYARRFPQHLGTTLRLTLADHEGAYGAPIAFTPRLWDEFKSRKGYDLRPVLPLLVRQATDDQTGRRVRRDYLDVISELYVTSFNKQVTDWCTHHGLQHATSLYEEQMFIQVNVGGDMFSQWRAGTAVFMDALLERARMPIDFKEAVSVAHFDRKPLLVENQGLQGHDSFFSLEKARLGSNMALLWGADRLIPYFDYDAEKIQWPPQWFLGQPLWRHFNHYANLVHRAQAMNGSGSHLAPVLLYYPLETAFAHAEILFTNKPPRGLAWHNSMDQTENFYTALRLELTRAGWDYHIADRHYLARATIRDGALQLADEFFRVLILAPMTDMDEAAAQQVRRFVDAGGHVLAIGELPANLGLVGIRTFPAQPHPPFMDHLDYREYIRTPEGVQEDLKPLLAALRTLEPPQAEVMSEDRERLYFSHRRESGVDWYWVVNDTDRPRQAVLRFPLTGTFEKWDAETGQRWTLAATREGRAALSSARRSRTAERRAEDIAPYLSPSNYTDVELRFDPHDAFFVVRHEGAARVPQEPASQPEEVLLELPNTGWRFTPEASTIQVPYAARAGSPDPLWLAPETLSNPDWWVIGPFPYDDHAGFFRSYPPEREFRPETTYPGASGEVRWQWVHSSTYTVVFRDVLKSKGGGSFGVYYAYVRVWSPAARRAKLRAAFADSLAAWWNGKQVFAQHRHTKWVLLRDCWAESAAIDIKKGWNTVLLKIGPSLEAATGFMFRITDETGSTLRDLVYAQDESLPASTQKSVHLTVSVPPGSTNLRLPSFRKPFRFRVDGQPVSGKASGTVRLPAGAETCAFEVSADDTPEHPISFGTGSVPFPLQCWTDSALAHFSGSAWYETEFTLAGALGESALTNKSKLILDLGTVGLAAEVWVNGQSVGSRAWRPFRFDISTAIRPGKNRLRMRVTNSNAGWLAQGDTIYAKGSWGLKFNTERDRLSAVRPNGLEGPVRILIQPQHFSASENRADVGMPKRLSMNQ